MEGKGTWGDPVRIIYSSSRTLGLEIKGDIKVTTDQRPDGEAVLGKQEVDG